MPVILYSIIGLYLIEYRSQKGVGSAVHFAANDIGDAMAQFTEWEAPKDNNTILSINRTFPNLAQRT